MGKKLPIPEPDAAFLAARMDDLGVAFGAFVEALTTMSLPKEALPLSAVLTLTAALALPAMAALSTDASVRSACGAFKPQRLLGLATTMYGFLYLAAWLGDLAQSGGYLLHITLKVAGAPLLPVGHFLVSSAKPQRATADWLYMAGTICLSLFFMRVYAGLAVFSRLLLFAAGSLLVAAFSQMWKATSGSDPIVLAGLSGSAGLMFVATLQTLGDAGVLAAAELAGALPKLNQVASACFLTANSVGLLRLGAPEASAKYIGQVRSVVSVIVACEPVLAKYHRTGLQVHRLRLPLLRWRTLPGVARRAHRGAQCRRAWRLARGLHT